MNKKVFLILCMIAMVVTLGQGMISPILPLYGSSFGLSASVVGFLVTSYGLARVLTDLPAGYLSERCGAAKVLLAGPAVTAIASLMAGLAGTFGLLVFWRFWQGVGSALFVTAATAQVAELSPPEAMARNLSLFQGFHLLGISFGPSLGGLAAQYAGYRASFFLLAALAASGTLVACGSLWWRSKRAGKDRGNQSRSGALPDKKTSCCSAEKQRITRPGEASPVKEKGRPHPQAPEGLHGILHVLANRQFLLIALVNFSIFFARAGARQTIVPLLGASELGLKEGQIGFALSAVAVGNLGAVYLAGWLGDRFGVKKVLVPSVLLASFGFILFATSRDYVSYLLAAVVLGLGTGLGGPLPPAYAIQVGGNAGHGVVIGALRFLGDVGFMAGPVALGLVADAWGYRAALTTNAALMAVLVALFALLTTEPSRRGRRREVLPKGNHTRSSEESR